MAPEIDIAAFAAAQADGATVVDVREEFEYVSGHVPHARWIPMGHVPNRLAEIPRNEPVYVICATGNRSLTVTDYLRRNGVDAYSVAGGTSGWQRAGHPVAQARAA